MRSLLSPIAESGLDISIRGYFSKYLRFYLRAVRRVTERYSSPFDFETLRSSVSYGLSERPSNTMKPAFRLSRWM
ncbi:MAG UNVERIFIED_CONTAM: hypothetical protein LVR29_31075 [Microcystis novacekii LVE1205-3]